LSAGPTSSALLTAWRGWGNFPLATKYSLRHGPCWAADWHRRSKLTPASNAFKGKIAEVRCVTRDGWALADCTLAIFQRLRKRGLVAPQNGGPYRATRLGLAAVRAQLDNR
jgi:uncharacterized protein YjhX (UPF0386 family)